MLTYGGSWHDNHQHLYLFANQRETPEFQVRLNEELAWVKELRAEINKHIDIYLSLLDDDLATNRLYIPSLLCALPEMRTKSVPALIKRVYIEADDPTLANFLLAISILDSKKQPELFDNIAHSSTGQLTRMVALKNYVLCMPDVADSDTINCLIELILTADQSLIDSYLSLPCARDFIYDMAMPLALACKDKTEIILSWGIKQLSGKSMAADDAVIGLLAIAFQGHKADLIRLTEQQRQAVRIVAKMAWPVVMGTSENMINVLRMFGLPEKLSRNMVVS